MCGDRFRGREAGRAPGPNAVNARAHERIIRPQGQKHFHWMRTKAQEQLGRGDVPDTDFPIDAFFCVHRASPCFASASARRHSTKVPTTRSRPTTRRAARAGLRLRSGRGPAAQRARHSGESFRGSLGTFSGPFSSRLRQGAASATQVESDEKLVGWMKLTLFPSGRTLLDPSHVRIVWTGEGMLGGLVRAQRRHRARVPPAFDLGVAVGKG